jgi:hypothetical protein
MAFELFSGLSQNFSQLLEDADDYDVIIKVGKNSNVKTFNVHSNILRARSPYFKRALSKDWNIKKNDIIDFTYIKRALSIDWNIKKNDIIDFNKQNISPIVFEMIIR